MRAKRAELEEEEADDSESLDSVHESPTADSSARRDRRRSQAELADENPPPEDPIAPEYPFCGEKDQVEEAMADWLASEVTPYVMEQYLREKNKILTVNHWRYGYSNALRSICNDRDDEHRNEDEFGSHPETPDRINKILSVNPKVREQMGCEPTHPKFVYCDNKASSSDKGGESRTHDGPVGTR